MQNPHIVYVLPWGARYSPTHRPGAIELSVEGFIASSRYESSTTVLGNKISDDSGNEHKPYRAGNFVPVKADERVRDSRHRWCALVIERLAELKPDVAIIQQTPLTNAQVRKAFPKLPIIYHRHDAQIPSSPIKHWGQNWHMRAATKLVSNSDFVTMHLQNRCLIPAKKIKRIYNSFNFHRFSENPMKKKKILCIAAMIKMKGPDVFAGTVRPILEAYPDWEIDFVTQSLGKGPENWRQAIRDQLSDLPPERFRMYELATYEHIIAMYEEASIAVVPSRVKEAFGRTALEAVASKTALITSGRGGLKEIGGPHAVYPERIEVEDYLSAIVDLIENPDKRRDMAQKAYDRALGLFHEPVVSAAYDALIDSVLSL